jgi:hypothetical protein
MTLVGITLFLILIGLGFFAYGAIALSKYAFRLGTGPGLLTLLVPPYTIYFALFKLEEEGKSWPTASWLIGVVVTTLLCITFYPDLSALARGDMERFEEPAEENQAFVGDGIVDEKEADEPAEEEPAEEEPVAEEATADAGADAQSAEGEDGGAQGEVAEGEESDEQPAAEAAQ